MRKGPVAGTEVTTGWGLKTFTCDALDKIHVATLDVMQSTRSPIVSITSRVATWI